MSILEASDCLFSILKPVIFWRAGGGKGVEARFPMLSVLRSPVLTMTVLTERIQFQLFPGCPSSLSSHLLSAIVFQLHILKKGSM